MQFKRQIISLMIAIPLIISLWGTSITAASPFTDVPETYNHYKPISQLVELNSISGFEDGTFRPHETLTRAQSAIIIGRTAELDTNSSQQHEFIDVSSNVTGHEYINSLTNQDVFSKVDSFNPHQQLTRAEMAKILVKAFDLEAQSQNISFNDVSDDYWASEYIQTLAATGITSGTSDNQFSPLEPITRVQMALFVTRTLEHLGIDLPEIEVEQKLTRDDAMHIFTETLDNAYADFEKKQQEIQPRILDSNGDKNYIEWSDFTEEFNNEIRNTLAPYASGEGLEYLRKALTEAYFITFGTGPIDSNSIDIRFNIIEQNINQDHPTFTVSFLSLESIAGYGFDGKRTIDFIKEGGQWKISNIQNDSVDTVNMIKEDITDMGYEFVDTFVEDGKEHIAYIQDGNLFVKLTEDGRSVITDWEQTHRDDALNGTYEGDTSRIPELTYSIPNGFEVRSQNSFDITGNGIDEEVIFIQDGDSVFEENDMEVRVYKYSEDQKAWLKAFTKSLNDVFTPYSLKANGSVTNDERQQIVFGVNEGSGMFLSYFVIGSSNDGEIEIVLENGDSIPQGDIYFDNKQLIIESKNEVYEIYDWNGNNFTKQ